MLVWWKSTMTSTRRNANNARVGFSSGGAVDQTKGAERKVDKAKYEMYSAGGFWLM